MCGEADESGVARDTACRAHSKTLPPGRRNFGVRWQAKRDTALRSKKTEPKLKKVLNLRCVCPGCRLPDPRQGGGNMISFCHSRRGAEADGGSLRMLM